jgi:hypothetical protein
MSLKDRLKAAKSYEEVKLVWAEIQKAREAQMSDNTFRKCEKVFLNKRAQLISGG